MYLKLKLNLSLILNDVILPKFNFKVALCTSFNEVTQEIRGDHEGGRNVFGERHVGKATQRGCVGKG